MRGVPAALITAMILACTSAQAGQKIKLVNDGVEIKTVASVPDAATGKLHYVDAIIDTGASVVSMSEAQAQTLQIAPTIGDEGVVGTANGDRPVRMLSAPIICIQSICAKHVSVSIRMGDMSYDPILIGLSFFQANPSIVFGVSGGFALLTDEN
jgi:gag-polyprotein putative aspartyl protease